MSNLDKGSKDILLGALIGGVLGACATAVYFSSKTGEKPERSSLSSIGRLVVQMGEMLTQQGVHQTPIVRDIEKKVHAHEDTVANVMALVSLGIQLWEKFRKEA